MTKTMGANTNTNTNANANANANVNTTKNTGTQDLAIVGMGCRLPGGSSTPDKLWEMLAEGKSAWSPIPKDRFNLDGFYHPSNERQGAISIKGAHFLQEDLTKFDAPFFNIPADEAKAMDPQQRMLLEVTYEAFESAGIKLGDLRGSKTSVFVASFVKDYEVRAQRDPDWQPVYTATGTDDTILSNRLSYVFDLVGASVTINTACSGSLVALHLAAQSLRTGEADIALVGGAGTILSPNAMFAMTSMNFLSPDGKCFTFDSRANGYGRGEGFGVIVLKRVPDAIAANDTIRSVIRGTSVNQDGKTPGITLPRKEAQMANIKLAYESAGLDWQKTGYVECHGTGTQAGDLTELSALSETVSANRPDGKPLVVGSIKTNIGHLEGASGIAGVIKAVMALERAQIPPNINFVEGNQKIPFDKWNLKVPTSMLGWPVTDLRRASVNSFGFGGTNAHAILDEAPAYLQEMGLRAQHHSVSVGALHAGTATEVKAESPCLFVFSSNEKSGVQRLVRAHHEYTKSFQPLGGASSPSLSLADYAYTLLCRRSVFEWKGFVVAQSVDELETAMAAAAMDASSITRSKEGRSPRICFVFGGQGAVWALMGVALMRLPTYRQSITEASRFLQTTLRANFCLADELARPAGQSTISSAELAQVATTALQVALVDVLAAVGIVPASVVGHSSGEIAAAYAMGGLSREEAWATAYFRGVFAGQLPPQEGGMMAVGEAASAAAQFIQTHQLKLVVACVNSPKSVTLSGPVADLERAATLLAEAGLFFRRLDVPCAYHSQQMGAINEAYQTSLASFTRRSRVGEFPPKQSCRMFSSVSARELLPEDVRRPEYWGANLCSQVQFLAAMETMLSSSQQQQSDEGLPDLFLEISPAAALRTPVLDTVASRYTTSRPVYTSALKYGKTTAHQLWSLVGTCWAHGVPVDLGAVMHEMTGGQEQRVRKSLVDLPTYPWNHDTSYWHEGYLSVAYLQRQQPRRDLIGAVTMDSTDFHKKWVGALRLSENPWVVDHQVQKTILYPAAGMVAMVVEGARDVVSGRSDILGYELLNVGIEQAMIIPTDPFGLLTALSFQFSTTTTITSSTSSSNTNNSTNNSLEHHPHDHHARQVSSAPFITATFEITSKREHGPWTRNASGTIRILTKTPGWECMFADEKSYYHLARNSCHDSQSPRHFYEVLDILGMNYGPLFQNITSLSHANQVCVATVQVPDTKSVMPEKFEYDHVLHPATLDAMIQTLFGLNTDPMVPTAFDRIFIPSQLQTTAGDEFTGFSLMESVDIRGASASITMNNNDWQGPSIVMSGLHFTRLENTSGFVPNNRNLTSEFVWKKDVAHAEWKTFTEFVELLSHKVPQMSVLQVGGDLEVTKSVMNLLAPLDTVTPRLVRYTVCEVESEVEGEDEQEVDGDSSRLYEQIGEHWDGRFVVEFLEKRSLEDGLDNFPAYTLIIIGSQSSKIPHVDAFKAKLVHGGGIFVQKPTDSTEAVENQDQGQGQEHEQDQEDALVFDSIVPKVSPDWSQCTEVLLILPDAMSPALQKLQHNLYNDIEAQGVDVSMATLDHARFESDDKLCISLLSADNPEPDRDDFLWTWNEDQFQAFKAVQEYAQGLLWITRGSSMTPTHPKAAGFVGLARTIMSEEAQTRIATLDVSEEAQLDRPSMTQMILDVFGQVFLTPRGPNADFEFSEDKGSLYIPRLLPVRPLNELIENHKANTSSTLHCAFHQDEEHPRQLAPVVKHVGIDEHTLRWVFKRQPAEMGADEVEIQFRLTSLHHADLDTVTGRSTDSTLGRDMLGTVLKTGARVRGINIGDTVAALSQFGTLFNRIRLPQQLVRTVLPPIDQGNFYLPYSPSCYVPAYQAFLAARDALDGHSSAPCVLIQAAASTYGQAALHLAQVWGYRVFCTVLGPHADDQRAFLTNLGVDSAHILDGDSEVYPEKLRLSVPEGVELVYNPTQRNTQSSLRCVQMCGTVFQFANKLGQREQLPVPQDSFTYILFDLDKLIRHSPGTVSRLMGYVDALYKARPEEFARTVLHPEPTPINHVERALAQMEKSPFLGAYLVHAPENILVPVEGQNATITLGHVLQRSKTFLIVGGVTGLGASIAKMLVERGRASHIAFVSRSGASTDEARAVLRDMNSQGVDARAFAVDICQREEMLRVVREEILTSMPAIGGVVQCAAVLRDTVFDLMTYQDWCTAFRPKTEGSWNLYRAMEDTAQDPWYLFLSSASGIIGNRAQANYAAGNSFQDAMAHYLTRQGKTAFSLDFGPVLGAGMLARNEQVLNILRASGFFGIRHEDFLTIVEKSLVGEVSPGDDMPTQVVVGVGTGGLLHQNQPADPYWSQKAIWSYLALVDAPVPDLSVISAKRNVNLKTQLAQCADVDAAATVIEAGFKHRLSKVLNQPVEVIDADRPPRSYGVDSLTGYNLANWIQTTTGVAMAAFEVLSDSSIRELAKLLARRRQEDK